MSVREGIDSIQNQVAKTLAQAQCVLAYIAAHPEKEEVFGSAVHELNEMIKEIQKVKLKNPRINMLFTGTSLLLGAKGGVVDFARSVTESLVENQVGVCPTDPLSVIGFYHTQIVVPIFGATTLALQEPLLRVAVGNVMRKIGISEASLIEFQHAK